MEASLEKVKTFFRTEKIEEILRQTLIVKSAFFWIPVNVKTINTTLSCSARKTRLYYDIKEKTA